VTEGTVVNVFDGYMVDPKVSLLDKTRIQAQVLVPVLRALRAEFGKEKADAIVKQALRDWSRQVFAQIGNSIEGRPKRKWAAMHGAFIEVTAGAIDFELRREDKEALEFDVTRCRFAEFFRALGEPELGALLVCEADFDVAAAAGGDVSLDRAQTIMEGAPSCTFRFKFAPR
jgi:predicted ArsR family transcriptional regulator